MKKFSPVIFVIAIIMIVISSCKSQPSLNQPVKMLAGTYTEDGGKGLFLFNLNREQGTFELISSNDAGPNPSYFCISKKHGMIYASNEVMHFNDMRAGGVTSLKYDPENWNIEKVNDLAVPNGGPAYISLSAEEDYLLFANYSGGSIAVVKLDDKGVPQSVTDTIVYGNGADLVSHAHMIAPGPGGRIYVTDLGLDQVVAYDLNRETGRLAMIPGGIASIAKGSGPRHFTFNDAGSKMYVINELNSTISVFDVAQAGTLSLIQTISTLDAGFTGKSYCADIHFGKNGEYLYGSNRGENTIVVFKTDGDGKLTLAGRASCGGEWPRNFVIDPSGKFLLVGNQNSGNISFFAIDENTGLPTGTAKDYKIKSPVCLKFPE